MLGAAMVAVLAAGCSSEPSTKTGERGAAAGDTSDGVLALRGPSSPTEHVGLTTSLPLADRRAFDAVASELFGDEAAAGTYLDDLEVGTGIHLSSGEHPAASDQVALTVSMDTTGAEPASRTVAAYSDACSSDNGTT